MGLYPINSKESSQAGIPIVVNPKMVQEAMFGELFPYVIKTLINSKYPHFL